MSKLQQLINKCKCGVHVTVNEHRDYYETAEQALEEEGLTEITQGLMPEVEALMVEKGTIIRIQFYPDTPVGFHVVLHHDLELALDQALEILN